MDIQDAFVYWTSGSWNPYFDMIPSPDPSPSTPRRRKRRAPTPSHLWGKTATRSRVTGLSSPVPQFNVNADSDASWSPLVHDDVEELDRELDPFIVRLDSNTVQSHPLQTRLNLHERTGGLRQEARFARACMVDYIEQPVGGHGTRMTEVVRAVTESANRFGSSRVAAGLCDCDDCSDADSNATKTQHNATRVRTFYRTYRPAAFKSMLPATMVSVVLSVLLCCATELYAEGNLYALQEFCSQVFSNIWRIAASPACEVFGSLVVTLKRAIKEFSSNQVGQYAFLFGYGIFCTECFSAMHSISVRTLADFISRVKTGAVRRIHGRSGQVYCAVRGSVAKEWVDRRVQLLGDYMPDKEEIHLPPGSMRDLHLAYVDEVAIQVPDHLPITYDYFTRVFHTHFSHVKIPATKRFASCDTCASLKRQLEATLDPLQRQRLQQAKYDHNQFVIRERAKYYKHRRKARTHPERYMSMIVDAMDQAKTAIPKPKRATSSTKNAEPLNVNCIGVLCHGHEPRAQAFFLPGHLSKDSSLICHVILSALLAVQQAAHAAGKALPPILYLQLDNASSENKNYAITALAAHLVKIGLFRKVSVGSGRWCYVSRVVLCSLFSGIESIPTVFR